MDYNTVVQLIGTVGFPIVMCGILAYYIKYLTDKHSTESEKFAEALNSNTIVLNKLCERIGVTEND